MSIPTLTAYTLPLETELPEKRVQWKLEPQRCALLIHDMQDYFLNFWPAHSPLIKQITDNLVMVRELCHQQGIPVFYTAQPEEQHATDRGLLNDMWGAGITRYPQQKNITRPLTPGEHDTVLVKWRYSAFQRSDFEQQLRQQNRDQLLIGGVYAHIGCLTTANDAFMRDIQPFMLSDGVADFSQQDHLMALHYTAGRCGRVLSTRQAISELSVTASTVWDREQLLLLLTPALDSDINDIANDDNLLDYGLDSVQVMSLVSQWRKQGYSIDFVTLIKQPTLTHWLHLLNHEERENVSVCG